MLCWSDSRLSKSAQRCCFEFDWTLHFHGWRWTRFWRRKYDAFDWLLGSWFVDIQVASTSRGNGCSIDWAAFGQSLLGKRLSLGVRTLFEFIDVNFSLVLVILMVRWQTWIYQELLTSEFCVSLAWCLICSNTCILLLWLSLLFMNKLVH